MNLDRRIKKLEGHIKGVGRTEVVAIKAKTSEEFEQKVQEYLKTNPEPQLFVFLHDFSDLYPPD